MSPDVFY